MADLSNLSDDELMALHSRATAAPKNNLASMSDDDLLALHAAATAPRPKASPDSQIDSGTLKAAASGAYHNATMNFGDEIGGGFGTLHDYLADKFGQGDASSQDAKGDFDLSKSYHKNRDIWRKSDEDLEAQHPVAHAVGGVGGALGTAFVPGFGALNAGKGAGLIEMGVKGALQGGIAGAGHAKEITDVPDEAATGAEWGGAVGTALGAAGKVGSAVIDKLKPAKVASVLLNVPEEAVERYIANPGAVNSARPRAEIVQDFLSRADQLKNEVLSGSKASREILSREGQQIPGNAIADIFDSKADEIAKRAEGVMDDHEIGAAYKWLRDTANKYRPQVAEDVSNDLQGSLHGTLVENGMHPDEASAMLAGMPDEVERQLSTNRVKDLVQSLGKQTKYEVAPGQFNAVDDRVRGEVGADINALLKSKSPAYTEHMKGVASDTGLLSDVADLAKSPQGFDNLLKRTQRGNTPHIMDSLNKFDQRTGGGMMSELQDSAVKDAFDRGGMHGSRNVNLHGGLGETIGASIGGLPGKMIGKAVGVLGGATVDKYGPAMAKGTVDFSSKINGMLQSSEGLQRLGKFAGPLANAAKNGNQSLAVTNYILSQRHPEYHEIMEDKERP